MFQSRSFRQRIFAALLAVAIIPTAVALLAGTYTVYRLLEGSGTAGPWDSVAESGQRLISVLDHPGMPVDSIATLAERHREALSESLSLSRRLAFLSDRFVRMLPVLATILVSLAAALAFVAARRLANGFSRPIQELVGWTDLISRQEPLPRGNAREDREVREFGRLRAALRRMASDLEQGRQRDLEAERLRSWTEMARRVAHELKNPLTPIKMAAASLVRSSEASGSEAARILLEEIERLDEMARSFSQFGRMPEGPLSEVDLVEMMRNLAVQHRSVAVQIELQASAHVPRVLGHYDALLRVFRNLLVNAVEAATSDGAAQGWVELRVEVAGDDRVQVVVRDSGPGFPPEALDHVWDPDFTTKSRGTGLGLPLVRRTVQAHDGEVRIGNLEKGGAEVRVLLPIRGPNRDRLGDVP